ncbi:NAD-dependent epimerase/dehydratase family protein [Planctomycetota bacterium]
MSKTSCLITGGAGFIGRWLVKKCLDNGERVTAFDNFFNSNPGNIEEFNNHPDFTFIEGDIRKQAEVDAAFRQKYHVCYHLAASIIVQDSIDDPRTTVDNDIMGTFHVLEGCRGTNTKIVFMSTCMVYDTAQVGSAISESAPTLPASPYAAAKLAGEALTISYYHAYGLPAIVMRPFNTYGPYQKSSGEGGVVAIFLKQDLQGEELNIYGNGEQTRDFLYVLDCADFIRRVAACPELYGKIINAGTGTDISINKLAELCSRNAGIRHIEHIHPQSEIMKLCCDATKAREVLNWKPQYDLTRGLAETRTWLAQGAN